jgi:pyruvate dehydrogenase E1 component alpha subunit
MIEAITYRWYDHSGFAGSRVGQEGAMGLPYRTDDEVKQWISRDPIQRFKTWLIAKSLANEGELTKIERDMQAAVDASIEFARKSPLPDPEAGVLHTYAAGAAQATQFFNRKGLVNHVNAGQAS